MEELNRSLFLMINAGSHPAPGMLVLATVLAEWLIDGLPFLLAGMWLWAKPEGRLAAAKAALIIALALLLNQTITLLWMHPRPFMVGLGHTYLAHKPEASFPSDHATVLFALALALSQWSRPVGWALTLTAVAVGWSRVYLGVHFPFDIVGGFAVAAASHFILQGRLVSQLIEATLMVYAQKLYRQIFAWPIARGWVKS